MQVAPYNTDNVAFQDLGLGAGVRLDAVLTNLVTAQPRLTEDKRFKPVSYTHLTLPTKRIV